MKILIIVIKVLYLHVRVYASDNSLVLMCVGEMLGFMVLKHAV